MSRLKISIKMMLWYTLLTSILLIIFIPILYGAISKSLYSDAESLLRATMSNALSGIEVENNTIIWGENTKISNAMPTIIMDSNNKIVFSNNNFQWLIDEPFIQGEIHTIESNGEKWLVFDETAINENKEIARLRVCSSLESLENTLNKIRLIIFISIPSYLIITTLGGLIIAKKALHPINKITQTAKDIGRGDLSSRIIGVESNDEVGELAETFNGMLERLEASFNKEKRFTSDASHELRTPVAIVMAYSESLLTDLNTDDGNTELEKSLVTIHKESKRMNTIISQLLMLTRGYEGKYQLKLEQIDLGEVISNVLEELEETAESNKITLAYKVENNIFLMADQSLLTQMMLNLVENAIKYGKAGGNVWVTAAKQEDDITITVSDNGIGIAADSLPFIFERFYRADQSRDRSGTGLGLSIVKWIVQEHHGKIEVKSELGKGTTFEIRL